MALGLYLADAWPLGWRGRVQGSLRGRQNVGVSSTVTPTASGFVVIHSLAWATASLIRQFHYWHLCKYYDINSLLLHCGCKALGKDSNRVLKVLAFIRLPSFRAGGAWVTREQVKLLTTIKFETSCFIISDPESVDAPWGNTMWEIYNLFLDCFLNKYNNGFPKCLCSKHLGNIYHFSIVLHWELL